MDMCDGYLYQGVTLLTMSYIRSHYMSDHSILADKINKKELEIQYLEERLKVARIYVQALRDALGTLQGDSERIIPIMDDANLRQGSAAAMARDAILRADRPLHVDELLLDLGKPLEREARQALASAISAYVRKGEIFTRPAPNTFGLLALGHNPPKSYDEPPEEFGGELLT